MNDNEREPEHLSAGRRPWEPHSEQDVDDLNALYAAELAYNKARNARETKVRPPVDDDGEHGASETVRRWERDREAGIDA